MTVIGGPSRAPPSNVFSSLNARLLWLPNSTSVARRTVSSSEGREAIEANVEQPPLREMMNPGEK